MYLSFSSHIAWILCVLLHLFFQMHDFNYSLSHFSFSSLILHMSFATIHFEFPNNFLSFCQCLICRQMILKFDSFHYQIIQNGLFRCSCHFPFKFTGILSEKGTSKGGRNELNICKTCYLTSCAEISYSG